MNPTLSHKSTQAWTLALEKEAKYIPNVTNQMVNHFTKSAAAEKINQLGGTVCASSTQPPPADLNPAPSDSHICRHKPTSSCGCIMGRNYQGQIARYGDDRSSVVNIVLKESRSIPNAHRALFPLAGKVFGYLHLGVYQKGFSIKLPRGLHPSSSCGIVEVPDPADHGEPIGENKALTMYFIWPPIHDTPPPALTFMRNTLESIRAASQVKPEDADERQLIQRLRQIEDSGELSSLKIGRIAEPKDQEEAKE